MMKKRRIVIAGSSVAGPKSAAKERMAAGMTAQQLF
jgi:hypothetical protein